jgi:hypothetical protein
MHTVHPSIKFDYDKWYRKLLNPLLTECHTLWLLHNSERHSTEQQQKHTRWIQQLERDLNDLFKYEPTVLASDKDIFSTPVSELIALPPSKIGKWIKSRKPIILHSRREAIKCSITTIRLLPTYFPLLPSTSPLQNPVVQPVDFPSSHRPLHHIPSLPSISLNTLPSYPPSVSNASPLKSFHTSSSTEHLPNSHSNLETIQHSTFCCSRLLRIYPCASGVEEIVNNLKQFIIILGHWSDTIGRNCVP